MNQDTNAESQILKGVETLNIEISTNKEIVREFYKNQIRSRMIKQKSQEKL